MIVRPRRELQGGLGRRPAQSTLFLSIATRLAFVCLMILTLLFQRHILLLSMESDPVSPFQKPVKIPASNELQGAFKVGQTTSVTQQSVKVSVEGNYGDFDRSVRTSETLDAKPMTDGDKETSENSTTRFRTDAIVSPAEPLVTANLTSGKPIVVAYAISLLQCGDDRSTISGMSDAAAVMQHSIHKHSVRNPESGSKYDYKLYAIVHKKAEGCSDLMRQSGFEVIVHDMPFDILEIKDETLIKNMNKAWCCGPAEFIKLYAYLLPHPLAVHLDIDFIFTRHSDELFDAMLYDKDSPEGKAARAKIPRERHWDPWPDKIEAAMTRDWGQVIPGRKPGYQAGFVVVQPSKEVFDQTIQTILRTEYIEGFSRENGWGGKGYGGFVGSYIMQGFMAYFYDEVRPNTWVELNQCRFNHMGMDVLCRSAPSFMPRHPKRGQCRNDLDECEDCQTTSLDQIYSIHFTQCRKPWNCIGEGSKNSTHAQSKGSMSPIPEDSVILDHCLELQQTWHSYRTELEEQLFALTGDDSLKNGTVGDYKKQIFQGHCRDYGGASYLPIGGSDKTRQRIPELYRRQVLVTLADK